MRRFLLLPALAVALGLVAGLDRAAGQQGDGFGVLKSAPASGLPTGIQPEQSRASTAPAPAPPNPYPLPAEAGPWLICAAHFIGFDGADLAKQLVEELRNKHHLKAWIYNRADEERRKQDEEWEQYKKRFPPNVPLRRKYVRVQDEWAVLVGDFKDCEAASKFLPRIKSLPIPDLKVSDSRRCPFDVVTYHEMDPKTKQMVSKKKEVVSPYHFAMAVRNPLTATNPQQSNWDPIWPKLNAYEDFSLLKNPKAFTLLVKKYSGAASITAGSTESSSSSSKGILAMFGLGGSNGGEALNAAGAQAHELARFLRDPKRFGFDAYVLHSRTSSIVTVGAFSSPTDPELLRMKRQLVSLKFSAQGTNGNPDPIGLMPDPVVILVPKP